MFASCEENIIELLIKKSLVFFSSTVYIGHQAGREGFLYYFLHGLCGFRTIEGRLDDYGVSSCKGICKRLQGEKYRIVPWTHHQYISIGCVVQIAMGVEL